MRLPTIVLVLFAVVGGAAPALSDSVTPDPLDPKVHIRKSKLIPGNDGDTSSRETGPSSPAPSTSRPAAAPQNPWEYVWRSSCAGGSIEVECAAARVCPEPGRKKWTLYGRPAGSGTWQMLGTSCGEVPPPVPSGPDDLPADVRPQVTPDLVLTEVRTLGLPTVQARVQPSGETLVNFDTIFYAERPSFERTVGLLGYTVDVTAAPTRYAWHHGDGTSRTTTSPGAPYPSTEITHRYTRRATHSARVDVTYQVRFRVDGGEWQTIDELLTATGPATSVVVREAAPLLTS